jgi:hypothetical protein
MKMGESGAFIDRALTDEPLPPDLEEALQEDRRRLAEFRATQRGSFRSEPARPAPMDGPSERVRKGLEVILPRVAKLKDRS